MTAVSEAMGLRFSVCSAKTGKEAKLAMESLWLTGKVLPVGARLVLRHVFKSAEKKPLEVVYTYGLPRDATLRSFRVEGEGFSVTSELKPTQEAVQEYEEALREGHLASMNRVYKDGLSSLTVGNVRPGETVAVYLEILAGVENRDDGFRFRFPFTLAPCYHGQARVSETPEGFGEMELPADQYDDLLLPPWSRDAKNLHTAGFDLEIACTGDEAEVASPSHLLAVRPGKENITRVRLANMEDLPDRDLVLDVRAALAQPKVFSGTGADGATQFIALVPSSAFGKQPAKPVRSVFVIDRSGSMGGAPMDQAKGAVRACLGALTPEDQFGIVAFDNKTDSFASSMLTASMQHREKAAQFLDGIDARGGTELLTGLKAAEGILDGAGGDIFLLTDGQVYAGNEIMAGMRDSGIRVHCLGIGSASQDRFLSLLARETGGVSRFLTPCERVDLAALTLFASVGHPVATELACEVAGLKGGKVSPAPTSVVFDGTPVVVYGSGKEEGDGMLRFAFEGDDGSAAVELPLGGASDDLGETLRLLRGARVITDLESRLSGETRAKDRRADGRVNTLLEEAGREYGLSSSRMSLVAVVHREGDQAGEVPETRVVPVGMPQDTEFGGYFRHAGIHAPLGSFQAVHSLIPTVSRKSRSTLMDVEYSMSPMAMEESSDLSDRDAVAMSPAFLSQDLAGETIARREDISDALVGAVALIEADGGMPGDSPEERVAATLALLLALHGEGHTTGHGPFGPHMRRMVAFLRSTDLALLDLVHRDLVRATFDILDTKGKTGAFNTGEVARIARQGGMAQAEAWECIQRALRGVDA